MPAASRRSRTRPRKRVNWLKTSARWPPSAMSRSCSASTSSFARRQVCRAPASTSAGCSAELAQQGQRPQDREPVPVACRRAARAPSAARAAGRCRRACGAAGRQLDLEDLLLLGGQVGGHLLLGPAHDQRLDAAAQLGQSSGSLRLLDRLRVVVGEPGRAREQAGRGDRQQRPQLHQVVLHRRAGDRELERRRHLRAHW